MGNEYPVVPRMKTIELGEKIAREIDEKIKSSVISAVVYGFDIHGDSDDAKDCNMVIVLDHIGLEEIQKVHEALQENMTHCTKTPILVEYSEIEGMGDSVPSSFLDVLTSYQTVYGKSLFKGLSSINHEHLRAQVEQKLRENLLQARTSILKGYVGGKKLDQELVRIKNLFNRSLHMYMILKKPWLVKETEKWSSFLDEFSPDNIWLRTYYVKDLGSMDDDEKRNLSAAIVEAGIKPLLTRVDELGPE